MHDTSVFAQQYVKDSTTKQRKKQTLLNKLRQSDRFLGINRSPAEVDAITDPITREQRRRESQKMREQDEAQLRRLIQAEQDRWARDRSLAEYTSEGELLTGVFRRHQKKRVHSHIEKLKGGHTKIEDIQREARAYFGGDEIYLISTGSEARR